MRTAAERTKGPCCKGDDRQPAVDRTPTATGVPSSDPARQLRAALRAARLRGRTASVDAAAEALQTRALHPFEAVLQPSGATSEARDLDSKAQERDVDEPTVQALLFPESASYPRSPETLLLTTWRQDEALSDHVGASCPAAEAAEVDERPKIPRVADGAAAPPSGEPEKADRPGASDGRAHDARTSSDQRAQKAEAETKQKTPAKSEKALLQGPQKKPAKPGVEPAEKGMKPQKSIPLPSPNPAPKPAPAKPESNEGEGDGGTGGDPVGAWQSGVVAKANAISAPAIPDADRYVAEFHPATPKRQSAQEKLDLIASAKTAVPPVEKFGDEDLALPKTDLPTEQAAVRDETKHKLSKQEMPPLERSPLKSLPELGTSVFADERGGRHVIRETAPGKFNEILTAGPGGKVPEKLAWAREADVRHDEKKLDGKGSLLERVQAHNAKEPRNLDPKGDKSKGAVFESKNDMPKQGPVLPRLQGFPKVDTTKVIARILDNIDPSASSIAEGARTNYPGHEGLDASFMADFIPGIKGDLVKEMGHVAHACGAAGKTLDRRLEQEGERVQTEIAQNKQAAEDAHKHAVKNEKLVADDINDHIGDLLDEMERRIDDQTAVAKGGFEPKEVNAQKQRMLDDNTELVETALGHYKTLGENRVTALTNERMRQESAYEATTELDKRQLDAQATDLDAKDSKEIAEARANLDHWLADHRLDLAKKVGPGNNSLVDQANTEIAGFKKTLTDAADAYEKAVKAWADKRLGHERKWWNELIDAVRKWLGVAKEEKKVWGERSTTDNKATCDKNELDLDKLIIEHTKELSKEEIDDSKELTDTQKAMYKSYFLPGPNKGDSVAALAAGLVESVRGQWQPRLGKMIEDKVLKSPFTTILAVAEASNPVPRLDQRAHKIYSEGFKGAGTHKDKVYEGLAGLTPVQAKGLEIFYETKWPKRSLKLDIGDELYDLGDQITGSKQDYDRAMALLKGAQPGTQGYYDSIAIQLNAAMKACAWGTGLGTDKQAIFSLMRGKTAEERQAIKWAYKEKYGKDLDKEVDEELDDGFSLQYDSQRYAALSRGDTEAADAIAMRAAHGWQSDDVASRAINWALYKDYKVADQVYQDMRTDVEADAQAAAASGHPWDTAEFDRQLKKRLDTLDKKFGERYGAEFNVKPGESALETAHQALFSGDQAKLLTGERRQNFAMESAARISIEHKALILPDKKEVNKTLEAQYDRSFQEKRRDLESKEKQVKQDEYNACLVKPKSDSKQDIEAAKKATEEKRREWGKKWLSPEGKAQRKRDLDRQAEREAQVATKSKMGELKLAYEKDFSTGSVFSSGSFEGDVYSATNVGWPGERNKNTDKTMALLAGSGYLSPDQQLLFAVKGAGTDEAAVHKAYAGRSKEEIEQIHRDLQTRLGVLGIKDDAKDWVLDDFSGDELIDVKVEQMGEPITMEEKREVERERVRLQKESTKGSATTDAIIGGILLGPLGAATGHKVLGDLRAWVSEDETAYMDESLKRLDADIATFNQEKAKLEAQGIHEGDPKYYERMGKFYEEIDLSVEGVKGAVAGQRAALEAAVSWVTVGIQVVVGVASLVAGILLTPVTGGASVGVAIAVISSLVTTGLTMAAKAALKGGGYGWEEATNDAIIGIVDAITAGITAGYGGPVLKGIGLGAEIKNVVGEFVRKSVTHFITGAAQAIPSALIGALISDGTISSAFEQILQGGLMSVAIGHLTEPITQHFQARKALAARSSPVEFEKAYKAFQQENPHGSRADLRVQLDKMIVDGHLRVSSDAEMHKSLRGELLEGLPPAQREAFKNARIEIVSEHDFPRVAGKAASDTVGVLMKEDGPVVVVKAGTDLKTLGKMAPSLFQPIEAPTVARVATEPGSSAATRSPHPAASDQAGHAAHPVAPVTEHVATPVSETVGARVGEAAVPVVEHAGAPVAERAAVPAAEHAGAPVAERAAAPVTEPAATGEQAPLRPRAGSGSESHLAAEPAGAERLDPRGARGPEPFDSAGHSLLAPDGQLHSSTRNAMVRELRGLGAVREELRALSDHELVERYVAAQAEQAPKRLAEFRSKLNPMAQGELDALHAASNLHQQPVDANLASRLHTALDTPVHFDTTLNPGEIRVGRDGRSIHVGPGATLGDVLGHVPTVGALKRYQGAIGIVHRVADAVGRVFGRGGPPVGTRAFEAWHEIQKLPGLIESRRTMLLDQSLDPTTRLRIEGEISRIEGQLARHVGELGDLSAGRGYVAVEGAVPNAQTLEAKYRAELEFQPELKERLVEVERITNQVEKATALKGLQPELENAGRDLDAIIRGREAAQKSVLSLRDVQGRVAEFQKQHWAGGAIQLESGVDLLADFLAMQTTPEARRPGMRRVEMGPDRIPVFEDQRAGSNILVRPAENYPDLVAGLQEHARALRMTDAQFVEMLTHFNSTLTLPEGVHPQSDLARRLARATNLLGRVELGRVATHAADLPHVLTAAHAQDSLTVIARDMPAALPGRKETGLPGAAAAGRRAIEVAQGRTFKEGTAIARSADEMRVRFARTASELGFTNDAGLVEMIRLFYGF
jgi:hypothetical protein